jgi:hypothetical protein
LAYHNPLGNDIGTEKASLHLVTDFLRHRASLWACKRPEVLRLPMRVKCRLVRIDLVQQHAVATRLPAQEHRIARILVRF